MQNLCKCAATVTIISGFSSTLAHADTDTERAMLNAGRLVEALKSVDDLAVDTIVSKISNGTFLRYAPEQPVWLINESTRSIMYYQGQQGFAGQSAEQLVDDVGTRFGIKALDNAKASRSGWIQLVLAGKAYKAYCAHRAPYTACSLVVPSK